jgi:FkbM family methyltransferase
MKTMVRKIVNKIGFDLVRIKNSHDDLGKHLSNVLRSRNIDCVLDVGANSGQYGLFLRSLGYQGYIISFEPVKEVFKILKKIADKDNNWICYNFALGDANEEKILNVYQSTVFSSFLKVNDYSKNIWRSLENVSPEVVKIHRLEDIWLQLTGELKCKNYMIKLDTQGFDRNVFNGAIKCLDNIKVLQSELSLIPVYEGMDQVYDILKDYNNFGFLVSGMYAVNRDESLAVIEYDCVLVKRDLI